ncbi:hypothetical protein NDA14_001828 [Ustilago hordei]|nr:hypothetical protein NDA14_001828 [Ustilago hordei]
MESYFKDGAHIALMSSQEEQQTRDHQCSQPDQAENTSPQLSWRSSSSSSTTVFDCEEASHPHERSIDYNGHEWSSGPESSDTLVGTFIANHFSSLKQKGKSGYMQLPDNSYASKPRLGTSKKKAVCLLLFAATLLGAGGKAVLKAINQASHNDHKDPFTVSLHDEDSLQDASIEIPTLPRPVQPFSADEVLPFKLHHDDSVEISTIAPQPSATNKRQLTSIPAQQLLFDKQGCVEAWVGQGTVCDEMKVAYRERPDHTSIDLLYSWVNGSDWRHSSAKWLHGYRPTGRWQEYVEEDLFPSVPSPEGRDLYQPRSVARRSLTQPKPVDDKKLPRRGAAIRNRFRDHEELCYSMRSATKHLHGLANIHIVSPDFSAPYHLQPGAKQSSPPNAVKRALNKVASTLRRRSTPPPFMLDVQRLTEGFVGLPSQLRRVQGLGTDRFTSGEGQIREGQVPQWLSVANATHVVAGQEAASPTSTSFLDSLTHLLTPDVTTPKVHLHHDWNAFTENWLVTHPLTPAEHKHRNDYKRAALPTFNSMAVESMLGNQPGLNDNFISSNDDFFFLDDATTADFTSPLFGPVMRLDYNLVVEGKQSPDSTPGEWSSLWHTSWLLDQRFGQRSRPYVQHVHKSFSKSLLQEARVGWAYEHAKLGLNRFRNGGDNIVTHFLAYYNVVERHREALLWSFFMLRLDEDGNGLVSSQELQSAMSQMGLTQKQMADASPEALSTTTNRNLTVTVKLAKRTTLAANNPNSALIKTSFPVPLKSRYAFTSQDGYPLGELSDRVIFRREVPDEGFVKERGWRYASGYEAPRRGEGTYWGWPDFVDEPAAHPKNEWHNRRFEHSACQLDLDRCLLQPFPHLGQSGKVEWEQIFKRFTHVDVSCGDCLIHHLVSQSGQRGLNAFLPPSDRTLTGPSEEKASHLAEVPHLPLTSSFNSSAREVPPAFEAESPCFTLSCILSNSGYGHNTNLRTFASQLIQRYSYTIAESPVKFERLETQNNARKIMTALEESTVRESALDRFRDQYQQQHPQPEEYAEVAVDEEEVVGEAEKWLESQSQIDTSRPILVCINDDITDRWIATVGPQFTKWLRRMWPEKQPWEL